MPPTKRGRGGSSRGAMSKSSRSISPTGKRQQQQRQQQQQQQQNKDLPPSAGYLISCDVPTKQYILYLNEVKPVDKKFVLEDMDSTHLLVKRNAREEIERKVEAWMDENVFSAVEKVGEDLGVS